MKRTVSLVKPLLDDIFVWILCLEYLVVRNQAYPGTDSEYTEKGKANIQKSTTGVRVGDVTSARKNVETRPKNMAILWIIRIF